ncbi:MAG: response regulator [Desulfobulbaceae bacterium]|nr:MAG: response regulator [Desulfobulbaceae bacterium]
MKKLSLPRKINTAILVTATVIAAVFLLILYPVEHKRQSNEIERITLLLDTIYKQKHNDLANEMFARQDRALKATLAEIKDIREEIVNVCLHDRQGVRLLCHDNQRQPPPEPAMFAGSRQQPQFRQTRAEGLPLGTYLNSIEVIGDPIGFLAIHYDLSRIEQEGRALFAVFFLLLLATVAIMALLQNIFLSRAIIRPVSLLRNAMRRVGEGHLGETVRLPWRDEIGEMGDAFNDMSLQLLISKEDLKRAEKKYRDIFEQSIEGIFQTLPDHSRFITANPSLAQILGFSSPQELLESLSDMRTQLFLSEQDWRRYQEEFTAAGRIVGFETQLRRKDCQSIWVSLSARVVLDLDGIHIYNEGSIVDITERRQRERAERDKEAAEAANRAKSEFLAKMSHEIRTPLNAIMGFTEILESGLEDQQTRNYAQIIRNAGGNLLQLINDILDLSKIEAGRMELQATEVDIRHLLQQLTEIFSGQSLQKGLTMRSLVDPGVPRCLLLDIVRLRQILFNLIGNAVKFTDHGDVEVHVSALEAQQPDAIDLLIRVSDSGIGIAEEARQRIFEAFRQHHGTRQATIEGSGLGLTISKNLVEAMGGSISCESRVGHGSVFTVRLPGIPCAADAPDTKDEPGIIADSRNITFSEAIVLIADDLEINRRLIRAAFAASPVQIVEAEDGHAAVRLAAEYRPDLILMDIRMPGIDGHQAFREIRRQQSLQRTPIIALTASGMQEDIRSIRQTGFDDFLIRPFNLGQLKQTIARYLGVCWSNTDLPGGPGEGAASAPRACYLRAWQCPADIALLLGELHVRDWMKIRRSQRLSDIRDFSGRLLQIGDEHGLAALREYGQELAGFTAAFDIEHIQKTLDDFPELLTLGRI